jgi:hypothetical protein
VKTDHLIDMLARGVEPAERGKRVRDLALVLVLGLLIAVLGVSFIGIRPDIVVAPMPVMLKALFAAAAAGAVLPLAMRLARPGRPLGWRLAAIGLFVGVAAIAAFVALMGEDPEDRLRMWMGTGFPWCLVLVPLLAAPTAAGLIWLVRGMAPTRLMLSGAAIGAVSGGIGAMAYAMYCPVDSVAFVTTWYVVAIAICAALGALAGWRLLRW